MFTAAIKASGGQVSAAWVPLAAYWLVGVPLGAVLAFPANVKLDGCWWGMIVGVCLHATGLGVLVARTDWEMEAERAAKGGGGAVAPAATAAVADRDGDASGEEDEDDPSEAVGAPLLGQPAGSLQ